MPPAVAVGGVATEEAVTDCNRGAAKVVDAAPGVVGQGAAADRRHTGVGNADVDVPGHGAVVIDRQRGMVVDAAATAAGAVIRQSTVADRRRAVVVDAAAPVRD